MVFHFGRVPNTAAVPRVVVQGEAAAVLPPQVLAHGRHTLRPGARGLRGGVPNHQCRLTGGCKHNDSSKKLLVFCFWSLWATQGPGLGPNVPPGTSFRTPKHRPSPANGDPTGGETTFWKNLCFCNLPVSGGDRFSIFWAILGGRLGPRLCQNATQKASCC